MSSPRGVNKKIILSTTEVSKLLLSKGRRKINESFNSHPKTNNIDITEITSQVNIKLSKEGENTGIGIADQSMFKGVLEKSVLFKSNKNLDKSGFLNNFDKFNQKVNVNNILGNLDKSQTEKGNEGIDLFQELKARKKILRIESKDALSDKNQIKLSYIINNYFPYENENNTDMETTNKLKNYKVIFYFIIEKNIFVLIQKFDKKFIPMYFWNREEDAKRFGIKYSQITTPGLYFKNFENFKNAFKEKMGERELIVKLRNTIKENSVSYEQNIKDIKDENEKNIQDLQNKNDEIIIKLKDENELNIKKIKSEYEKKITEISGDNTNLKNKIKEIEKTLKLKDDKIKELQVNIKDLKDEINIIRLINEKLKQENIDKSILNKNKDKDKDNSSKKMKNLVVIKDKKNEKENENKKENKKEHKKENKKENKKDNENKYEKDNENKYEKDNEKENEYIKENKNDLIKFKSNQNMIKAYKKAQTKFLETSGFKRFNNFINEDKNNNDNNNNVKDLYKYYNSLKNTLKKEYLIENIIQITYFSEEISMPKFEEYDIGNEEEDEINKVKNIKKIKTYGDKSINISSDSNISYNNNIILYINQNSDNKKEINKNNNNKNNSKEKNIKDEIDKIKKNYIPKSKYDEDINAKNQEILILKNKIESLNLEIQNKGQIIEELKYLLESKSNNISNNISNNNSNNTSNNNSNFDSVNNVSSSSINKHNSSSNQ